MLCISCKRFVLVFSLLAITSFELGGCADDDEGPPETPPEITCTQTLITLTKEIVRVLPHCLFGPNTMNFRLTNILQALPRIYCLLRCLFTELEFFEPDGQLDETNAVLFFQETFPEYAIISLSEKSFHCFGHTANFKPDQYYCQSYSPFIQCLFGTMITGIGPFALECVGIPFFQGLFGILSFVVPQERLEPGEQARRRRIQDAINGTYSNSSSFISRIKDRREQFRLREQAEAEAKAQRRISALPTLTTATSTEAVLPDEPSLTSSPSTKPPSRTFNFKITRTPTKRWRSADSSNSTTAVNKSRQSFNFKLDFLWTKATADNRLEYHTNNTDTIVYQMDRITNLAKSLQILLNNTSTRKFY